MIQTACCCSSPDCRLYGCRTQRMMHPFYGYGAPIVTTAQGCICPPGAEKTCQGFSCPRRGIGTASADTLPEGQDAQQGLAGTESGAVGATSAETPSPSLSPAAGR